jgi:membrane associated rhomboid family serine protease
MFLPYEVDVPLARRPVANYVLIGVTVAVFGMELMVGRKALEPFLLTGWENPLGWFTSMFLHAGFIHIIGNMVFLWQFGNAVCSKVGNAMYVPIYVGMGLAADVAHMVFDGRPALGSSGAIFGIVGLYVTFFPLNRISCLYFILHRLHSFSVAGYWVILYWVIWNMLGILVPLGNVGHMAHLGGFAAGFGLGICMLKLDLVTMEKDEMSILQAWQQGWRERTAKPEPPVRPRKPAGPTPVPKPSRDR